MARAFKDMDDMQRSNVLAWALSHDWGSKSAHWHEVRPDSELVVYGAEHDRVDGWNDVRYSFTNMRDLRAWAGY